MSLPELDSNLFFLINKGLQNGFFDLLMPFITKHAELVFFPLVLWAATKEKKAILRFLLVSVSATALADGSGHILKDIIARQRPCNVLTGVHLLVGCGSSFSLPSNHACNSFAFAMTFFLFRRNIVGYFSLAVAALIGFSRVYVGVHYPFDVLAGMVLGSASACAAILIYRWGGRIYAKKAYGEALGLSLLLLSLFRVYFILTGPFDLSPDEAHYWEWSRHIDWSYYSKGPMIAYIMYLGTAFFGDTVLGVRIFAVVFSAGGSFLLYLIGRDLYDEKTGLISALLMQIVPLYSAFGILMTIDSPFIFFWSLSLYLFHRIMQRQPDELHAAQFDYYWVLLGISVGLGLLTKYTMAFFLVSGFLLMLTSDDNRRLLRTPWPYIALAVSLVVFSPVIFWNAAHGWVTLKHTAGQAHLAEGLSISARSFLEFVGSQLGVVTPVLFILIFAALWKLRKSRQGAFLFWLSLPTIAFFALKSLQGKVQANWALPAYETGFIAFAACYLRDIATLSRKKTMIAASGVALSFVVTVFLHFPSLLHLPRKIDLSARLAGWKELGAEVSMVYREMSGSAPVFILSDKYTIASELAFYMEGHPVTYCINLGRRMNQYDLWPGFAGFTGRNAVFVSTEGSGLGEKLEKAFDRCEGSTVDIQTKQKKRMKFEIFKCYDFKGMIMRRIESF